MKVILTTTIKKLGKMGDKVSVKPGYARNFLFPNNMALRENKKNIEYYEKVKDKIKIDEEKKINDAKILMEKINKIEIIFNKESDEKDQLYGSISKKEILDYLSNNNIKVKSDDLIIKNQIKSIGEHIIEINPYEGIHQDISINQISLSQLTPSKTIKEIRLRIAQLTKEFSGRIAHRLGSDLNQLNGIEKRLHAVSPFSILDRGYSIVTNSKQEIIKNVGQAKPSEKLSVKLSDGELSVEVSK